MTHIPAYCNYILDKLSKSENKNKQEILKEAIILYYLVHDKLPKYVKNVLPYIVSRLQVQDYNILERYKTKIKSIGNQFSSTKILDHGKRSTFSKAISTKSFDLDELEDLDIDNVKDIKKYVKSLLVKYFGYENYRDLYEQKLEYVIKILKISVYSISDIFTILTKFFNDYLDYSSKIYSFHYQLLSELDEVRKKLENKDLKLSDLPILTNKLSNVIEKLRKYFEVVYNIVDRLENVYTFVSEFIEKDEKKRILFEFLKFFDIENIENLEIVMNEHKKVKNEIFTRKRIGNRNIFNSE